MKAKVMVKSSVTIDLAGITTKVAIHQAFKQHLGFPDWYGPSWDALWDAIIAVVEMPDEVVLYNWQEFAQACPKDMQILHQIIADYHEELPNKQIVLAKQSLEA
jgi:RNAse (barnase) inhibitor barstar